MKAEGRTLGVPRALSAHNMELAGSHLPHILAVSLKELCQDFSRYLEVLFFRFVA